MARRGKINAVNIEFGKDNKSIIHVLYDQELMKKIKTISERNETFKESKGNFLKVMVK